MQSLTSAAACRYTWFVLLSAVLYGCALFAPAVGAAATITVQIIKPAENPIVFDAGVAHDFEAVVFIEGVELEGGQVTWDWNFGDNTDHSADNPTTHTYAACGNFTVTVTATYQGLTGQDTVNAAAAPPGAADGVIIKPTESGVCDQVEISCRRRSYDPSGWTLCRAEFYRDVVGAWVPIAPMPADIQYVTINSVEYQKASISWGSWDTPNPKSARFLIRYQLGGPWNGGPAYVNIEKELDLTPTNTVVKATPTDLIKHYKGDTEHAIGWSITHLGTTPPLTYDVHIQVLDIGGSEVASHTEQTTETAGTWDWQPTFGPMGGDANALYTYKVTAGHGVCTDSDKTDAISEVSLTDFAWVERDYPNSAYVTLHYSLNQPLSPCELKLYKRDLGGGSILDPSGGSLPSTTGSHEVRVKFAVDKQVLGNYWFVITGTQADGSGNRDMVAKPAVPRGAIQGIWPPAIAVRGAGFSNPIGEGAIVEQMGRLDSTTQTQYAAFSNGATAWSAREALRLGAVVYTSSHSNPKALESPQEQQTGWLESNLGDPNHPGEKIDDAPEVDHYLIQNIPSSAALFVFYNGCHTWSFAGSPVWPSYPPESGMPDYTIGGLVDATVTLGVGAVAGFSDFVDNYKAELLSLYLFKYAIEDALSIDDAYEAAFADTQFELPWATGGIDSFRCTNGALRLKDARFEN